MSELLPCPFCGGKASKRMFYGGKYGIYCDECSARVGGLYNTEAEAIAAWNTRADDYRQAAEYWQRMYEETFAERTCHETMIGEFYHGCDSCGWVWEVFYSFGKRERPNYCPNCGAKVVSE